MLRIAEEVRSRLNNGEEPDSVRGSYRSQSQVCEGFRLYINDQEMKIRKTREDLASAKMELEQTTGANELLQREKKDLSQDVEALRSEKAGLQKDVDDKRAELGSLREGVETLKKRGFNQGIVTRLSESVDLNGQEVWRVLESVEARARLMEEIDIKRVAKDQAENEVSRLDAKKQRTKNSLHSAKKRLAIVETKADALAEVVDLVESGFRAGYKIEDLRALLSYLIEKNIGKSPGQSLAHLLQLVEAAKSLEDLRAQIILSENRLTESLRLEEETKARVDMVEKVSVTAIEQQKDAALKAMDDYSSSIRKWLHGFAQDFEAEFEKAKDSRADVARLEQQAVHLKKLIESAQALIGILESNEQLRAVQPATVIGLLERMRDWVQLRWGNALVGLTYYLTEGELRTGIVPTYYVIIHTVINAAIQAVKEQTVKEEAEAKKQPRR